MGAWRRLAVAAVLIAAAALYLLSRGRSPESRGSAAAGDAPANLAHGALRDANTNATLTIAGSTPATPSSAAELPHPHPLTARHQLIFRENALLGQLNGAIDVKDGAGVRKLLDEYRREFPDDPNELQDGYAVIADCLDQPGPDSTAAGRRYADVQRGSILRRFVLESCGLSDR